MSPTGTGISNRESPEEEQDERDVLARPADATRDRAGHVGTESAAERVQRETDAHVQAPSGDSKRSRGTRTSTSGG
jgi:hypothetical protein